MKLSLYDRVLLARLAIAGQPLTPSMLERPLQDAGARLWRMANHGLVHRRLQGEGAPTYSITLDGARQAATSKQIEAYEADRKRRIRETSKPGARIESVHEAFTELGATSIRNVADHLGMQYDYARKLTKELHQRGDLEPVPSGDGRMNAWRAVA